MSNDAPAPIIVKRVTRSARGHHGGAWKVAYADFVTAMMAFFLVMWILGVGTDQQRAAIAEYFRNPSRTPGTSTVAPAGLAGPGGASTSMIQLGGTMDMPEAPGKDQARQSTESASPKQIKKKAQELDRKRLEQLKKQLHAAIQNSQALEPFKDQLLIDITSEGLRIQIVDKRNRPMFSTGSAQLKDYTRNILHELAHFINRVPNHISITGHTDDAPYISARGYSNWELSTDRANAARRALLAGGLKENKVAKIVGLADTVPLDKMHPDSPTNRRISIIVMNKKSEAAMFSSSPETNQSNIPSPAELPQTAASASASASVPASVSASASASAPAKSDTPSPPTDVGVAVASNVMNPIADHRMAGVSQ